MMQESYAYGASTHPLLKETIGENLRKTVERYPDKDALISVHQNYKVSYADLWQQIEEVAKGFLALNVKKGDRVGIWSPNRFEWVLVQYATARIGAILVNINPAYQSSELSYVLQQSGVNLLVSALSVKGKSYKKLIYEVWPLCDELKDVVFLDTDWGDFLIAGKSVTEAQLLTVENSLQPADPINIQYTSGTTGFPKGATLSHLNILNNGYFIGRRLNYTADERVCIPVPFYHCFGMVIGNLCCTSHGACMVIPSESFEPMKVLRTIDQERCTSLYGVPTMFIAMLQLPKFDQYNLSTLRTGVMAGSPCPVEIMKQVQSKMYMREVAICYGMTETSPVSTQTIISTPLEKQVSTVGTVQDHLEIKIVDPETGHLVDRNQPGEFCTRGYSVMIGYWNNEEATAKVIDEEGWMHSGDLASMDEQGYINIVGRITDMICRGGDNIYPREIEEVLYTHEAIADVQVIGVPSEKYIEEVMAWVKLKPGFIGSATDFRAFCKGKIANYKTPRYWKFVDSFPMTITGKIRKAQMREESIEELGLREIAKIRVS